MDPPEMPVETLSDALMGRCVTPVSEDHGEEYGVPSLEELGEETNVHTRTIIKKIYMILQYSKTLFAELFLS